MDRKNTRDTQKLYAAWGTTREEHMNRMLEFIERQNARVATDGASVLCRVEGYPSMTKTGDRRITLMRQGLGKPVRDLKTKNAKGRRRR